ncbi:hypothetical protein G9A89_022460 [Geosiphon pyriformis]|nr:hypothetical protein G9A89_022460 [Geosiphon pyriformis]
MSNQQIEQNELLFHEKEDVLCFHGPLLYEARVLKAEIWNPGDSETGDTGPHYYIHYKGWKSSYDEWVANARVLKYNQDNLEEQARLKEKHNQSKKRKSAKITPPKAVAQEDPLTREKPSTLGASSKITKPVANTSKRSTIVENKLSESSPVSKSGRSLKPTEKKEEIKKDESKSKKGKEDVKKEAAKNEDIKSKKGKDSPPEAVGVHEKGEERSEDKMDIDLLDVTEEYKAENTAESQDFMEISQPQEQDGLGSTQDRAGKRKFAEVDKTPKFNLPSETEALFRTRPEIEIGIPESLQIKLVDDWETIAKLGLLPRPITFNEILGRWVEYQRKQDSQEEENQKKEEPIQSNIENSTCEEASSKLNMEADDAENKDQDSEFDSLAPKPTANGEGNQEVGVLTPVKDTNLEAESAPQFEAESDGQRINEIEAELKPIADATLDLTIAAPNNQKIVTSADNGPSSAIPHEPSDIYHEVVEGLKKYFERTLRHTLLYNSERPILTELLKTKPNQSFGDIFGAEHMLRLFVKLPEFLAHTEIEYDCVQELTFRITQIMAFLNMGIHEFFDPSPTQITFLVSPSKKPRINPPQPRRSAASWKNQPGLTCANCGTQDTPGWRVGSTQDEKLCNACGLYYAKHRIQRPSNLWGLIRSKRKA